MFVTTGLGVHECTSAKQYVDGVHLFDESGDLIVILASPEDIRSVEGGEIIEVDYPEPTQVDILEARLTYMEMMAGLLEA